MIFKHADKSTHPAYGQTVNLIVRGIGKLTGKFMPPNINLYPQGKYLCSICTDYFDIQGELLVVGKNSEDVEWSE